VAQGVGPDTFKPWYCKRKKKKKKVVLWSILSHQGERLAILSTILSYKHYITCLAY
jgi:hypothetical protein